MLFNQSKEPSLNKVADVYRQVSKNNDFIISVSAVRKTCLAANIIRIIIIVILIKTNKYKCTLKREDG